MHTFAWVLELCEIQLTSLRIWTRVAMSIAYDDNITEKSQENKYRTVNNFQKVNFQDARIDDYVGP